MGHCVEVGGEGRGTARRRGVGMMRGGGWGTVWTWGVGRWGTVRTWGVGYRAGVEGVGDGE